MRKFLLRLTFSPFIVIGLIGGFFLAFLVVWFVLIAPVQNARFARALFSPILSDFDVLASRRWHPIASFGDWACTYAVVEIPDDAPDVPPRYSGPKSSWQFGFGGEWQNTPFSPLSDTTRDALGACRTRFDRDVAERLERAWNEVGSLAILGSAGETIFIYSKPQRIAARIRYGE